MKRLTKRYASHVAVVCDNCEEKSLYCDTSVCRDVMRNRLAEYEDMEEQGLLVRLPCQPGSTVYEVCNNTDACTHCVYYISMCNTGKSRCANIDDVELRHYPECAEKPLCKKQYMEIVEIAATVSWAFNHRKDFGKTIFRTREAAEKALEEVCKENT